MASLNKVLLIGNLGTDPELTYTPSGTAVCKFSIATSYKSADREVTEWHRIVAWDKLAGICSEYLKKGRSVYIEGRIQTRSWEKDGQKKFATEIIATAMQMLGGRVAEPGEEPTQREPKAAQVAAKFDAAPEPFFEDDKDLPF